MALQLSAAVRNARLDAIETTAAATAKLAIFSGSIPANCAAADGTGELVRITCPADYFSAAAAGAMALLGTWSATATGTGTPVHFRFYKNDGTTCFLQGSAAVGSGDLNLNGSITSGQTVTISTFTLTDANA